MAASLRTQIAKQVQTAFHKNLGDLPRPFTYRSTTGVGVYDNETGTTSGGTTDHPLAFVIKAKFTEKEAGKWPSVQLATDQKMILPALDLPVNPSADDVMIDEHSGVWEIVKVLSDPGDAAIVLQARSTLTHR